MPSKKQCIEDVLGTIEDEFYKVLKGEEFENYFGGRVDILYSTKPRLEINIREIGKSGPKPGTKFKRRVGPSKAAMRAMHADTEEFKYGNGNPDV
jgi:hypothetical protein